MKHGEMRNIRMEQVERGNGSESVQAVSADSVILLSPYRSVCECYCETCKKWREVRGVLIYGFCPGCNRPWRETTSFAGMCC